MTRPKTIDHHRAGLLAAKEEPTAERAALVAYIPTLAPILPDVSAHIYTRVEIEQTKAALAEFDTWSVENRALTAVQNYLETHAVEIVAAWRETIKDRTAKLPGVLANYGKKLSELAINAFTSDETKESNRKQREAVEESAAEAEAVVEYAQASVRGFEVMQTMQAFESADARVNQITFSKI